jgi:mRNA interferase YafQ
VRDLKYSKQFAKDSKLLTRRGKVMTKLRHLIELLATAQGLPAKFKDHPLSGDFAGFRECHLESDWLVVYQADAQTLYLVRTGTHADIFG